MLPGTSNLPDGLSLRPAGPSDQPFIQSLYASTRNDLRLVDGERDFVESLIDMQFQAQSTGYGSQFPNAMYFIVEKLGERIGRVTLDFGTNEVRLVDIAFITAARGKGYGTTVLKAIQHTAAKIRAPVALSVMKTNLAVKRLYLGLGFRTEESGPIYERMVWYPNADAIRA